ncbi:MAG: RecX family transcriptional regulator [Chloroflexota bacterium]
MTYKITALKVQKRNPNRVNVYLDGEFAFGLSRIVAAWLQEGQEIDQEKLSALQAEDKIEKAYQHAVRFLSYRIRSEAEVRCKLQEIHLDQVTMEIIINRLRHNRLLDDEDFAQAWVENRCNFRPRGRRYLASELRQKGISEEIINKTLDHLDEEALANKAASKYFRRIKNLDWPDFRRKLYGYLARRGFEYQIISSVVAHIWAEQVSNSPTDDTNTVEE